MDENRESQKRVVVLGGGIAGLAAAHRLGELSPDTRVTLIEAAPRLGGVLQTVRRDGFLLERSADNFITNIPWAVDLCRRLGITDQLIPTTESLRQAFVVRRGRLHKIPAGFALMTPGQLMPLLRTPLLSPWGKLRLLAERFVPRRRDRGDESLASFARRRLGREAFERLVQPLVSGIYTADPEKLSLAATMPRFLEMERKHGSLIRAARPQGSSSSDDETTASGARYGLFVAPKSGMSSLVEALAARLPEGAVRLNTTVEDIQRQGDAWRLRLAAPGGVEEILCDGLIVTAPASGAANLLSAVDFELAEGLKKILYAGASVITLAYRREQIDHPLDGFGFVVPAIERRQILAASFSSVKFPGRAPDGSVLIRVFVGGACQHEIAELPDEQLQVLAAGELAELLGVRGDPLFCEISRWSRAMPQYHVGHQALVENIFAQAALLPNFALAGAAYHGVGIPHCIHSGETAAERVLKSLQTPAPQKVG